MGLFIANFFLDPFGLRFESARLNALVILSVVLGFPIAVAVRGVLFKNVFIKFIGVIFAGCYYIFGFPALLMVILFTTDITKEGEYRSFLMVGELEYSGNMYRLYKSDCGVLCGSYLVLRKENSLILGIKTVTILRREAGFKGSISLTKYNKIRLQIEPHFRDEDKPIIHIINP